MGNSVPAIAAVDVTVAPVTPVPPNADLASARVYTCADGTVQAPVTDPPTVVVDTTTSATLDPATAWRGAGDTAAYLFGVVTDSSALTRSSVVRDVTLFFAGGVDADSGDPVAGYNVLLPLQLVDGDGTLITCAPLLLPGNELVINADWQLVVVPLFDVGPVLVLVQQVDVPTTLLKLRLTFAPTVRMPPTGTFLVAAAPIFDSDAPMLGLQAVQFGIVPRRSPIRRVHVGWVPAATAGSTPLVVWWSLVEDEAGTPEGAAAALQQLRVDGVTHWLVRNALSPRQEVRVPLDQLSVRVPVVCSLAQPCVQFTVTPVSDTTLLPREQSKVSAPSEALNVRHRPHQRPGRCAAAYRYW